MAVSISPWELKVGAIVCMARELLGEVVCDTIASKCTARKQKERRKWMTNILLGYNLNMSHDSCGRRLRQAALQAVIWNEISYYSTRILPSPTRIGKSGGMEIENTGESVPKKSGTRVQGVISAPFAKFSTSGWGIRKTGGKKKAEPSFVEQNCHRFRNTSVTPKMRIFGP